MATEDHNFAGLLSAAHDLSPYDGPVRPYLVCSTPRSGSTLLCDALVATGRLGVPTEYLHRDAVAVIAPRLGAAGPDGRTLNLRTYLRVLVRTRTSSEGWFGMKCHLDQLLPVVQRDAIRSLLSSSRFVRILRRDRLAQAVSFVIARESDVWHSRQDRDDENPPATYDRRLLDAAVRAIAWHEAQWDLFFQANDVHPMTVWYEDMVGDPTTTEGRLGDLFGMPDLRVDFAATTLRRVGGGEKQAWRSRFLETYRFGDRSG